MEILLFFTFLISPSAQGQELERFEKRVRGLDAHLEREANEAESRLAAAEKFRGSRQSRIDKQAQARDEFKRRLWARDESDKAAFLARQEEHEQQQLLKQEARARERRQEINALDKKAEVIKPREYKIERDRP